VVKGLVLLAYSAAFYINAQHYQALMIRQHHQALTVMQQ